MNSQYFQGCDFNNSYIKWEGEYDPSDTRKPGHMPWGNRLRIQLDARCELTDEETGETHTLLDAWEEPNEEPSEDG